jgi:hypothetical protein
MRLLSLVASSALLWILGAAPAAAADLAPPTAVSAEPAPACPAEPLGIAPAPFAAITWPAAGEACYGCDYNPNCIWTCNNGSHGSTNVDGESACQQACLSSCGFTNSCSLI